MENGLYIWNKDSFNVVSQPRSFIAYANNMLFSNQNTSVELWHQILGHLSKQKLTHISSIPNNVLHDIICDVCSLSKKQRQPFTKSAIMFVRIIKLLHMDLWGPFKHISLIGAHYFLTIVDDYNRSTWTYLLPNKIVVASIVITFIAMVEN